MWEGTQSFHALFKPLCSPPLLLDFYRGFITYACLIKSLMLVIDSTFSPLPYPEIKGWDQEFQSSIHV